MRTPVIPFLISIVSIVSSTVVHASRPSPFQPALAEQAHNGANKALTSAPPLELRKRQGGCPSNYNPCSSLGAAGLCCYTTATCQFDQASHVACCPTGSVCTGTVGVSPQTISVSTTTTIATTQGTVIAGGVVITTPPPVSNQYYTYPAIPTTFANAAACSSAWLSCQTEYSSCTARLAGRTAGITISAANLGITMAATTISNPISICQSLSQIACYGLQTINCPGYGAVQGAATMCGPGMYGVGVGVALGIAGQVLG